MSNSPAIQAIIQDFISALSAALADEGSAAIRSALGGGGEIPTPFTKAKRGRPASPLEVRTATRKKGAKRSAEDIEATVKTLLAHIRKNPGSRVEQIGAALHISTKDLALPISKLLESKSIKKSGVKRATAYTAK